jgi:hypothetical protein
MHHVNENRKSTGHNTKIPAGSLSIHQNSHLDQEVSSVKAN